jgi:hypothetical protein
MMEPKFRPPHEKSIAAILSRVLYWQSHDPFQLREIDDEALSGHSLHKKDEARKSITTDSKLSGIVR